MDSRQTGCVITRVEKKTYNTQEAQKLKVDGHRTWLIFPCG